MKGLFLTGTDTDCGKTRVAVALVHALRAAGYQVAPFKPVAAGAERRSAGRRNADAETLIAACGGGWDYGLVNPYCFASPVSPHLAAAEAGEVVDATVLRGAAEQLAAQADLLLVEGAGGWLAPLGSGINIEDLALALGLPVVLVVGLRLGCLNHAQLSADRIRRSGAGLAGWIGSMIDSGMARRRENIAALRNRLPTPCLGCLPSLALGEHGSNHLFTDIILRILE